MTNDESLLARVFFKVKILESHGNAYEKLFISVMEKWDKGFRPVKPHGKTGDRKNDGFIAEKGQYYQVYAPESPSSKTKDAIKKCKNDFNGLKAYWHDKSPIKEYAFVFNDKYSGAYPELEAALLEIQNENEGIKCRPFLAKDLENALFELTDQEIYSIINYIPAPDKIEQIDYGAMTEVVNYLLEKQESLKIDKSLILPDFEEKIKFNGLSDQIAAYLKVGSYQVSVLYDFFERNSNAPRKILKEIFTKFYNEADKSIPEQKGKSDLVFVSILNSASPANTKSVQEAVLVLMAYYFESCDIFKEPIKN